VSSFCCNLHAVTSRQSFNKWKHFRMFSIFVLQGFVRLISIIHQTIFTTIMPALLVDFSQFQSAQMKAFQIAFQIFKNFITFRQILQLIYIGAWRIVGRYVSLFFRDRCVHDLNQWGNIRWYKNHYIYIVPFHEDGHKCSITKSTFLSVFIVNFLFTGLVKNKPNVKFFLST
jgi:hypothetical protein